MIYHIGITQCKWDNKIDLNKLWVEYERIIKEHGVICLFSQTKFFYELIKSNEKLFRYDLIWDKVLIDNLYEGMNKLQYFIKSNLNITHKWK